MPRSGRAVSPFVHRPEAGGQACELVRETPAHILPSVPQSLHLEHGRAPWREAGTHGAQRRAITRALNNGLCDMMVVEN